MRGEADGGRRDDTTGDPVRAARRRGRRDRAVRSQPRPRPDVARGPRRRRRPRLRADAERARSRRPALDRGGRPDRRRVSGSRSAPARSCRSRPPNARSTRARRSSSARTWTRRSSPGRPARGIPAFPGCATPTEVLAAWRAGAAAVKLFPASVAGPAFVREMRGPFPDIPLVPTGGVTVETAPSFIAAGAVAVGMGGWLLGDGAAGGRSASVPRRSSPPSPAARAGDRR